MKNTRDINIEEEIPKGAILESRVFSTGVSLETKLQANLNINNVITYQLQPLSLQLKFLILGLSKYLKNLKDQSEYPKVRKFFIDELGRLFSNAKSELKTEGTLLSILRLNTYGQKIKSIGTQLNLQLVKANKSEDTKGIIDNQTQLKIKELWNQLVTEFITQYLDNPNEVELDLDESKIITQSNSYISTDLSLDEVLDILSDYNDYKINIYTKNKEIINKF